MSLQAVGLLSSEAAFCYIELCIYVTTVAEMKGDVEDSSHLDYAMFTGSSVTGILKDVIRYLKHQELLSSWHRI
jgi:hypothetical protein